HTALSVCHYMCCSALAHIFVSDFQHVYMLAVILVSEKPPVAVFPHLALDLSPTVRVKIVPCCAQTALCALVLCRNLGECGGRNTQEMVLLPKQLREIFFKLVDMIVLGLEKRLCL
ncbi:hypothetical protein GOODEAATRI_006839, partial [Goodea atripinnis]